MQGLSMSGVLELIVQLSGAYLLVNGLIGILRLKQQKVAIYFFLTCICFSIVLLSKTYAALIELSKPAALATWSFYFLFVFSGSTNRWKWIALIIPLVFLIIPSSLFNTLYFLHLIVLLILCAKRAYQLKSSQFLDNPAMRKLWKWNFYGIITLIGFRLVLPIAIANGASYLHLFHLASTIFIVGTTSFINRYGIENVISQKLLIKEESSNYEEEIKRRLDNVLKNERVYLITDLTIQELAAKMHMRSSDLSTFLSNKLRKNFNDVINEYRVDEVKRLITDPKTDPKATVMELAYKAGFNSKATFNRIFKQNTGHTPKEYRKAHISSIG